MIESIENFLPVVATNLCMRVIKSKSRKTLKESQIEALNLSSLADLIYAYGNDLRVLHLNVSGAGFRSVHEALNELYDDVFEAYDAVAELAIARGEKVKNPSTVVSIIKPLEARDFSREEAIAIAREEGLKVLDAVCSIEGYDKAVQPVLDDIIVNLDKTLNYIFSRWSVADDNEETEETFDFDGILDEPTEEY